VKSVKAVNVALVVTNLAGGGAERSLLRLAAALMKRGHAVRMILLEDRIEHAVPPGLQIDVLHSHGGALGKWRAAMALRWLRLPPDGLTVSTLPFADEVAIRAGLPNLWCRISNTLSEEIAHLKGRKAARRLARYRRMYEGRQLVAVSDGVAEDLRSRIGLAQARIERIYNGFDFDAIRAAAQVLEPDLPHTPFVLHVGRFMPQKRHDLLFDAYRRSGIELPLVLLTQPSPALEELIAAAGLQGRVQVAGFRSNPYPWMRAAELLVLSSEREGLPGVLVEALACGTRVVSTDCPSGPREVLRGALARWLVPNGDAQALAEAMRAALAAPRPDAVALPAEFSEAHMVERYEALATVEAVR
jgi:glycosyltransferase involved in cell wall biosynthesis